MTLRHPDSRLWHPQAFGTDVFERHAEGHLSRCSPPTPEEIAQTMGQLQQFKKWHVVKGSLQPVYPTASELADLPYFLAAVGSVASQEVGKSRYDIELRPSTLHRQAMECNSAGVTTIATLESVLATAAFDRLTAA